MAAESIPTEPVVPAPLTRRERQRQATYDEIVEVSRRLMHETDVLSLRAVAAEMGMTAPALYRYVDSYHELVQLIGRSIYADVLAAMAAARDRYNDEDPAAQIVAAAVAFRCWALGHRVEFGLLFANPATADDERTEPDDGVSAFAGFFGDIYRRLWDRYRFPVPRDEDLDPLAFAALTAQRDAGMLPCDFPGMPIGMSWVFIRAWTRLYGTVTLEVFKHMDSAVVSSGALFRAMLEDNSRDLAFGADWPRVQGLMAEGLARQDPAPQSP